MPQYTFPTDRDQPTDRQTNRWFRRETCTKSAYTRQWRIKNDHVVQCSIQLSEHAANRIGQNTLPPFVLWRCSWQKIRDDSVLWYPWFPLCTLVYCCQWHWRRQWRKEEFRETGGHSWTDNWWMEYELVARLLVDICVYLLKTHNSSVMFSSFTFHILSLIVFTLKNIFYKYKNCSLYTLLMADRSKTAKVTKAITSSECQCLIIVVNMALVGT